MLLHFLNLNVPFVVVNRDNKVNTVSINSRLRSITKYFGFQNRLIGIDELLNSKIQDLEKCSFDNSNEILFEKREDSLNYLKNAINDN